MGSVVPERSPTKGAATCSPFSFLPGEGGYTVLALRGRGTTSGWMLTVLEGPEGLRLVSSAIRPCFHME